MARRALATPRHELTLRKASALETMVVAVVVVVVLYLGRAIAIPIAIAVLISFSLGPLVSLLRRHRVGRLPSVVIVVAPALLALGAFAYLVTTEIGRLAENIPSYQSNIEQKLTSIESALPAHGMLERGSAFLQRHHPSVAERAETARADAARARQPHGVGSAGQADTKPIPVEIENPEPTQIDLARSLLGPMIDPLVGIALVLLFVIFFLLEREDLRDRVIRLAGAKDLHRTTMAMDEAGYRVSRFLLMQTAVNSLFGGVVGLGLFFVGLPNAALWGGVAAVLRFIPYLGVIAASILPLALAFAVDPGWEMLFWTGGLFIGLELLVGNVVEPWLYGSSTGLSAVAFVISAIFWTWLWGPVGLLIATPLTVCLTVLGRYVPRLGFLDVLLGNQAPLKPEESFYQRLLAGDPDEATQLAEEFLKTSSLAAFYDEVALPALRLAEHDRLRLVLDDEHRQQIVGGFKLIAENLAPDRADRDAARAAAVAPSEIVLCVAGRSDLDEAASVLLAQRLELAGWEAVCLSHEASIRVALPELGNERIRAVCLSYLDPDAVPHARYLTRRFRRRLGQDIRMIVGFWGAPGNIARLEEARAEIRADQVVASLDAAIEALEANPMEESIDRPPSEPDIEELTTRVADVMAGRA